MAKKISLGEIKNHPNGHLTGYYKKNDGSREYYRSSYELIRMKELDSDDRVKSWTTKHGIRINYNHLGIEKNHVPDFLIEMKCGKKIIEEVKGYIRSDVVFKLKNDAAIMWCKKRGYEYNINYMKNI